MTGWDPPRRFAVRAEGEDGWFNALEFVIEARGRRGHAAHAHSGIFVDDWDEMRFALPGLDRNDVVVDYLTPHFIGLRADDGLCRFFVRSA